MMWFKARRRAFRRGGGSFGNAGATGEWGPSKARPGRPRRTEVPPTIAKVGDTDCWPSGYKWVPMVADDVPGGTLVTWENPLPSGPIYSHVYDGNWADPVNRSTSWNEFQNGGTFTWNTAVHGPPPGGFSTGTLIDPATTSLEVGRVHAGPLLVDNGGTGDVYRQDWHDVLTQSACVPPKTTMIPPEEGGEDQPDRPDPPAEPPTPLDTSEHEAEDKGYDFPPPFIFVFPPVAAPIAPLPRPRGRARPRARTRERKAKGAIRSIFRILDAVSESAEVVDCFYSALPKATRKRWEKGRDYDRNTRGNQISRGLIDKAGQYGIDGADWKLQALYHNWDKVDFNEGMECAIKNHFEDQIVGAVGRQLSKRNLQGITTITGKTVDAMNYATHKREIEQRVEQWKRENAEQRRRNREENARRRARARR